MFDGCLEHYHGRRSSQLREAYAHGELKLADAYLKTLDAADPRSRDERRRGASGSGGAGGGGGAATAAMSRSWF